MTPTHAPTPCVESGCFNLATSKGRCPSCQLIQGSGRVAYDQQRGSPRERGYDRAWERRRKWHLEAEPFCRVCGHQGNQVDHVIPHRGEKWLFDLQGNLQTLCESHHAKKTQRERSIPIGMMYPLDLPEPPHYRHTRLLCGPAVKYSDTDGGAVLVWSDTVVGRGFLQVYLNEETEGPFTLIAPAPRTAERAFWAHVMDCEAELVLLETKGKPPEWWADYLLDQRAEEAMARRLA